jgi:hypothetical protein
MVTGIGAQWCGIGRAELQAASVNAWLALHAPLFFVAMDADGTAALRCTASELFSIPLTRFPEHKTIWLGVRRAVVRIGDGVRW